MRVVHDPGGEVGNLGPAASSRDVSVRRRAAKAERLRASEGRLTAVPTFVSADGSGPSGGK
jgi:hypothetical protein